jgi:hypothetical protein
MAGAIARSTFLPTIIRDAAPSSIACILRKPGGDGSMPVFARIDPRTKGRATCAQQSICESPRQESELPGHSRTGRARGRRGLPGCGHLSSWALAQSIAVDARGELRHVHR